MKKFEWKSVLALALTGVLALGLTACGSSDSKTADAGSAAAADGKAVYRTLDEIKESGTINIGVFSDKNPFGYVDENGEYQGYDVYYARRLGEDLGVDVNFVSTEAANRIEYLQTGKVDVIQSSSVVLPLETAGAMVSALPREGIPTVYPSFCRANAITSVLSFAHATEVPFSKASFAVA